MRKHIFAVALLALATLSSCGSGGSSSTTPPPPKTVVQFALTTFATGFHSPLGLESPRDNTGRLFVVEQGGTIQIIQNNALLTTPFLDISAKITSGGELGLLGLAFHPSFPTNRRFYVNYTRTTLGQLQTVISEFQASGTNPNLADLTTERILLVVNQPFPNHKGGQLAFGPDGFLYIGLGDGGSEGDPNGNGQNTQTLLGKMLRIDVDHTSTGKQYAIPTDNPFAVSGGFPEIFAFGLRNPWRFSFDAPTGRLFVADVGQNSFEEVDLVTKGNNYGWNIMEGTHCFNPATNCNTTGLTLPIHDYPRSDGTTVIGGFVYRGTAIASLVGVYVFGDFGSGKIWTLTEAPANTWTRADVLSTGRPISSFGRDQAGELYVVDITAGSILKLTAM